VAIVRRAARPLAAVAVLLVLAGCRDSAGEGDDDDAGGQADLVDVGDRPEPEVPEGAPPDSLVVEDLVEGDGEPFEDGDVLTVHYVGLTWGGSEFASSWERGQPLTYTYGEGRWVQGWEAGVDGMRVGGRRRIVVPPELGYGQRGAPGVPAGETLVFVVDLLDVG
jgi:peptidylprolyl isomerase